MRAILPRSERQCWKDHDLSLTLQGAALQAIDPSNNSLSATTYTAGLTAVKRPHF